MRRRRLTEYDQQQRVARAYHAFNKMTPSLSQYASAYLGKRVKVVAHHTTQTDGKTIFVRPPLALAYQPEHWRQVCGTRGANGKQLCEACGLREDIITKMHHEIAHIAHGSFQKYDEYKVRSRLNGHISRFLPAYYDTLQTYIYQWPSDAVRSSLEVAGEIHEHLGMVHLTCEDHRINVASYEREPALWKRMHELSQDILFNGVEADDGTFDKWQDREPDQQIMCAPLFYMEGFDITPHFDKAVVDAVLDPRSTEILDEIASGESSLDNLRDSIELLSIWREHGLLQKHSEPRDPDADNEERDAFMEFLRQILKAMFGHAEKMGGPGDDTGDTEGPSNEVGSGGGGEDDPSEEIVIKTITTLKYLDDVPGSMVGVNVFEPGQGPCSGRYETGIARATEGIIGKAVAKSRVVFNMNARARVRRDQKSGKVDARNLGKRAWNEGDARLFKVKSVPGKRDYEVLIGFDISGSTDGGYDGVSRLDMLKFSVNALADTMNRLGVKFSIYAHNTGRGVQGVTDYGSSMDIYKIKTSSEHWSEEVRARVNRMRSGGSNLDGHTLQFYRKELDKSRATDKILMYFTDGIMPGMGTREELPCLKAEIEECRKRGYTLLGVGIYTDAPADHGLPTVQVDSESDYPGVIDHLAKRFQA